MSPPLGREDGFSAHRAHGDASGAGNALERSIHLADAHVAASGRELAIAANAVHIQLAAAGRDHQGAIDAAHIDRAVGSGDGGGDQARSFHRNSGQEGAAWRGQYLPIALRRQAHGITIEEAARLGRGARLHAYLHFVGQVLGNAAFERHRPVRIHPQTGRGGSGTGERAHPKVALAGEFLLREGGA